MTMNKEKAGDEASNPASAQTYIITTEGSLGLLALGYRGIDLWRRKREEVKNNSSSAPKP